MRRLYSLFPGFCLLLVAFLCYGPAVQAEEVWDPWEGMNRGIFWFNDQVDIYVLEPVARGYDWLMPDPAQESVTNFFENLEYPKHLVSDLVQLNFSQAGDDTARFLFNSTLGVGGLFDVADSMGLKQNKDDFGVALASYGTPAGPYLVLPILGPSNVRDGLGKIVDTAVHPFSILQYADVKSGVTDRVTYIGYGLDLINTRANMIENIETAKEGALDYYLFLQSAYYQYREGLLKEGEPDLDAIFDDEFDDEFEDTAP